jgi:hypothetical protein
MSGPKVHVRSLVPLSDVHTNYREYWSTFWPLRAVAQEFVCYIGQSKFLNLDVNYNNIKTDLIGLLFMC